ncbi:MAG: DUF222 domain-containing protein [Actinomycetota bacterium]
MFVLDVKAAIDEIEALEHEARRLEARRAELFQELERSGVYGADGHASAKVMMRHVARLSGPSAASRQRVARMLRDLPLVHAALSAGRIGVDQVELLGRVHSNRRVRPFMPDAQDWFLGLARKPFADFEATVRQWERLADEDGPEPNERMHRARRVKLTQDDTTLTWELDGRFAAMMGAQLRDIFDHYTAAELAADWEKARAEHGDDACDLHLPRTADQRLADALWQIFQDAASADGSAVAPDFTHDIVWSADAYEAMVHRLDGADIEPLDPDTFRCTTRSGIALEPYEAAHHSLLTKVRRVIVDASSTVIDLGRARGFTGSARTAAKLQTTTCFWPGCNVSVDRCQVDHTQPHARHGRTNPGNGAPACGRHNRLKEHGYRVWRDPSGEWHTYRSDGSEILN